MKKAQRSHDLPYIQTRLIIGVVIWLVWRVPTHFLGWSDLALPEFITGLLVEYLLASSSEERYDLYWSRKGVLTYVLPRLGAILVVFVLTKIPGVPEISLGSFIAGIGVEWFVRLIYMLLMET